MNIKETKDYKKIDRDSIEYPEKLRNIPSPPKTIYVRGNLPDPKKKAVAIVGARNASDYGATLSRSIAKILSLNDVEIISGLAIGIDSSSHIGAIEAEKPTYAVLGCGVDICYPSYNQNIYERMLDYGGGIISEQDIGTPPLPCYFPARNRIIAGLADVVIVVEAKEKSGSLITSDFALEQGKTIFACPGRVGDALSKGTNNLIKQGAYILTSVEDVLTHLGLVVDGILPKAEKDLTKLDYFERLIYDIMGDEPMYVDEIATKVKLPIEKCLNTLMSLELNGFVEMTYINTYKRLE